MIFKNRTILITGGTGSFGKTFVKRLLNLEPNEMPKRIIVFSRDEAKQHQMRVEYQNLVKPTDEVIYNNFNRLVTFHIGDVRDYNALCQVVTQADIVVNAAALKQVPSCEYFPAEAYKTNVLGAENLVNAICNTNNKVKVCVGISTDKACKPINAMGISKAMQERIFIAANLKTTETRFVCVRYGNVLASRGSVIPLFHEQIRAGNQLTLTTKDMTRFLMTLNDSVDLVIDAIHHASPGDIFIPITPSARMVDVATVLCEANNHSTDFNFIGIRPGEKIHEELIGEEEGFRAYKTVICGVSRCVIPSMLPELKYATPKITSGVYSSADFTMNKELLRHFLHERQLLFPTDEGELLR